MQSYDKGDLIVILISKRLIEVGRTGPFLAEPVLVGSHLIEALALGHESESRGKSEDVPARVKGRSIGISSIRGDNKAEREQDSN